MSAKVFLHDGPEEVTQSSAVSVFGLSRDGQINYNKSLCPVDLVPTISAYLSATNVYGITLVSLGTVAVIIILVMFIDTLKYIMKNSSSRVKAHSAFVIGVYPVVALATYVAILVPRAHLLAEAITQGIFMAAMYQLFCLFVAYCGGEAELIRKVKPDLLSLRVGPCCCWPCCCCLSHLDVNKLNVRRLRVLVLQLPVVQGLVYMALLVMWAERESLYQINYMYIQPIIILSILFGVWGMMMTITLLKNALKDYSMPAKFMVLQMVLLFAKLQGLGTRIVVWTNLMPCKPPITPTVYGNLIHNSLMLGEMVLLGYIARRLYKKPLPESENDQKQHCVINTHISTIGAIMSGENNNTTTISDKNLVMKDEQNAANLACYVNAAMDN